jgi:hypothetical protein
LEKYEFVKLRGNAQEGCVSSSRTVLPEEVYHYNSLGPKDGWTFPGEG